LQKFRLGWTTAAVTSRDQVEKPQRVLPSYFEGAYNPLIRRYFLGVFRFAQMALADVRILTQPIKELNPISESTARRLSG
jgi:hypothetical protein